MNLAIDDKRQLGRTQSISHMANLSKPNVPNESPIGEETVRTFQIKIRISKTCFKALATVHETLIAISSF